MISWKVRSYCMISMEAFINGILKAHSLSLSSLTKLLGYKSKTSISRIIEGSVRPDSILKFENELRRAVELSEEESAQLTEAAQIAIYGREKYLAHQALWAFIQGKERAAQRGSIKIISAKTRWEVSLDRRYEQSKSIKLTIVNCQYVCGLFTSAYRLLQRENTSIDHYIYVDDDDARTIQAMSFLMPVFYEKGYMGYTRMKAQAEDARPDCGINEADLLIVEWLDEHGNSRTDMILFSDCDMGLLFEADYVDGEALRQLGLDQSKYRPIKRNYFERSAFEDYLQYSRDYAALERDHAVWKIKPDVGVDQIPAYILKKAVQEGPVPQDDGFAQVLDQLEKIYRRRYENTCVKRKHAYTIFKRDAMYRFAMTGRMSDHFWMMRPFTPEERVIILKELLTQQQKNPYFHIFFLKDDSTLSDVEIALYQDEGMLILDSGTDYNLEQGHSEVMITHQRMLELYRDFFMNVLLQSYVYTEKETCGYLQYLINEIQGLKI